MGEVLFRGELNLGDFFVKHRKYSQKIGDWNLEVRPTIPAFSMQDLNLDLSIQPLETESAAKKWKGEQKFLLKAFIPKWEEFLWVDRQFFGGNNGYSVQINSTDLEMLAVYNKQPSNILMIEISTPE